MNPELQQLLSRLEDDELTAREVEELACRLRTDPSARQELVGYGALTAGIRRYFLKAASAEHAAEKCEDIVKVSSWSHPVRTRRLSGRLTALAVAASLAVVAGVWWFAQGREPAELGLRVTEVGGECSVFSVQYSESGKPESGVSKPDPSKGVPLVVGMELRQGDRVEVKAGGRVELKYGAEGTWIGLEDTAATFTTKDGGKYVQLELGRLTCSAAPQKRRFRIETRHGIASVVGTRFSMNVTDLKTDLSVVEGKVQCERAGKAVMVGPGQTAEVSAQGMIVSLPAQPRPGLAYEFYGLFGEVVPELDLYRETGSTPDIGPYVGHVERGKDWGLRFTGALMPPADGVYAFRAEADSGVRVTIDGKPVIDGWARDGARTGKTTLTKAAPAAIVVEYFFVPAETARTPEVRKLAGTTPTLRLFWTPPGGQEEPVPAAAYMHRR